MSRISTTEKTPTTTEIIETHNGNVTVKYRRVYGSEEAKKLMDEVDRLPKGTTYSYRHT